MMMPQMYPEAPEATEPETPEAPEKTETEKVSPSDAAVLPKSFFGSKPLEKGTTFTVTVDDVFEDEVTVSLKGGSDENPMDESMGEMDEMMDEGMGMKG